MIVLMPVIPVDESGVQQAATEVAINTEKVGAIRSDGGTGSIFDVGGVGFLSAEDVDTVSTRLVDARFVPVPVTEHGDDVTIVTISLNIDLVSHVVPFSDSGCQILCDGISYKATESLAIVMARMHAIEARWQGLAGARRDR